MIEVAVRVYRIAIIGHRVHRFRNPTDVRQLCSTTLATLMDQYPPRELCINTTGAPGVGQWVGEACAEYGVNNHLFFPCEHSKYTNEWSDAHKTTLSHLLDACCGLTVIGEDLSKDNVCAASKAMIDFSDFVVSFWEGTGYGLTHASIGYAINSSKIVLDGLNGLSMVTRKQINGWER